VGRNLVPEAQFKKKNLISRFESSASQLVARFPLSPDLPLHSILKIDFGRESAIGDDAVSEKAIREQIDNVLILTRLSLCSRRVKK
jgi:hypothetical protein